MQIKIKEVIVLITFVVPNLSFAKWVCHYKPPAKVNCIWVDDPKKTPDLWYKGKVKTLEFSSCDQALKSNEIPASEKLKLKNSCKIPVSNRKILGH